ncbi:ParB/RepB/Spo0J family partition protein [Cellulomonas sp. DKR-3]|uniref:ParB/RepB/Spo0J family partition protein n=1 Tax=Cellulomonas fulva TaxID=2835530 RepID=A0ABS5TWG8_9CELL|nr:ParB/RepB/Spo0J family partition protein [Cellulomonas fulva]MBT0993497.1 ParB/RepB/Spo0J family partition protein [Cellulomonas fulva]
MSEKRRGLGRGLGALIPTGLDGQRPSGDRPVDVFFPDRQQEARDDAERPTAAAEGVLDTKSSTPPEADGATTGAEPAAANVSSAAEGGVDGGIDADTVDASQPGATPTRVDDVDGLVPVPGARFAELPVGSIRPNPRQPRTVFDEDALGELVGSIQEIGVLQPVVVRQVDDGYELIMGERRWRATQEAGLDTIPAIIRETEDSDLLRDALLENLHRSQLNPLEEAAAYQQLLDDFGCTHEELASRIHRSRPQISNTLRLLRLPPLVQRRVAAGVLSAGHARALLGLADGAAIERLAQRIVAEGLSVRAVEEIVSLGGDDTQPAKRTAPRAGQRNEALDELATRLSDRLDTRVKVVLGKQRGRLTVEFASVQDLNRILETLAPEDPGLLRG